VKQLLIIRHAKSSWANPGQDDFDRPLNNRGEHDAPMMAQRLLDKKIMIDAFVSSTANRAITTAGYFAETYKRKKKDILGYKKLYHAYPEKFYEVISELDDKLDTVAIFAHNPGITYFANELTATQIDDMPTCGVFAIKADIEKWKDFEKGKKAFWFFDYPKL
jgi:phosphohistidine phosphatase